LDQMGEVDVALIVDVDSHCRYYADNRCTD
jgi:hypothetical protein